MSYKVIFTWWNKQTFGTFLKTLFTGIYVGKDESGNKYYRNKGNERWVIYSGNIEATKINSEWYLWMHHTIDKIPSDKDKKKLFYYQYIRRNFNRYKCKILEERNKHKFRKVLEVAG